MNSSRILIIEDESDLRSSIKVILEMNHYAVIEAPDGKTALEIFKNNIEEIDLVLCDINLPDISGYDLLGVLRQHKKLFLTPFIFLTAYADEQEIKKGLKEGADMYMTKPFAYKDLISAIAAQLDYSKAKKLQPDASSHDRNWVKIINNNFKQEFLSPLHSIINATFLMDSTNAQMTHRDFKDTIAAIYASSFRMFRDTRNLITFSLLSNNQLKLHPQAKDNVRINDVVLQVLGYYNNGLVNSAPIAPTLIEAVAVRNENLEYLTIIVTELIDNAVKHNIKNTSPKIMLKAAGDGFELAVENNTPPELKITKQDIAPFKKFHDDLSLNGLGLGLFLVKELCHKMDYNFGMEVKDGLGRFYVSA